MERRVVGLLGAAALQLVALVLAHELVFLARWGSRYNEVLAHSGHGASWSTAVATVLALGVGLAALATWRLARLGLLVRRQRAASSAAALRSGEPPARLGGLLRACVVAGSRTAALTAALLTLQEHLERSSLAFGPTGVGILLAPEYAGGLWIALGVGLVVGLVAGLFAWRRDVLLARLRASRAGLPRGTTRAGRRPGLGVLPPAQSILGRRSALRAPPCAAELSPAG